MEQKSMIPCADKPIVYARVVGYYAPTRNFNKGKQEEFRLRKTFNIEKGMDGLAKKEANEVPKFGWESQKETQNVLVNESTKKNAVAEKSSKPIFQFPDIFNSLQSELTPA